MEKTYDELIEEYDKLQAKKEELEKESEKNKEEIKHIDWLIQQIVCDVHSLTYHYTDVVAEEEIDE